ncbi:MAG: 30S ribosome-binding factor RbfA [Oscillospiraceae bacterium]|nr:30S ribosome-binding factor RbfA [Oscillospiraceae bacterium]MDD6084551.1 30S ribosome-binding factor RbfA [Oscillospiraceae bacterium]MDY3258232.1 30S ribosome-binding factor RbfA [Ruminococcus callidus]
MKYTQSRLSEDFYRELTALLRELKDPRIDEFLSIVHIDLTNDLSYCKVYVSSLNGKEAAKESVKGLKSASGWLKRELFKRLKLRKSPQLLFFADDSIEYGASIGQKIHDIEVKREESEHEETDE